MYDDRPTALALTLDGYLIVAGNIYDSCQFGNYTAYGRGYADAFIAKIDASNGNIIWIKTAAEITTLHEVARHSGAALVIDESFSKINFDMRTWQSAVLGDLEQAVIINSFSKNFHLQGLRLGSMLAKPTLLDKIVTVHQAIVSSAPSASQHLAIQYFKRHGPRIPEYCQQRELAISFAERSGWSFTAPQGTFYIFPRLADVAAFVDAARAHCIYVLVGTAFGSSYVDHVRFCFGKPLAELEEMLSALGGASNAA